MLVPVVDPHGPTHHDQAPQDGGVRQRLGQVEPGDDHIHSAVRQHPGDRPRAFVRNVLEDRPGPFRT